MPCGSIKPCPSKPIESNHNIKTIKTTLMYSRSPSFPPILLALCLSATLSTSQAQTVTNLSSAYRIVDLGDLPGVNSYSYAARVNNAGQVIGNSSYNETSDGAASFIWDPAKGLLDLGRIPSKDFNVAIDMNNLGVVVGSCYPGFEAYRWDTINGIQWLPNGVDDGYYSHAAYSINDAGAIAFANWRPGSGKIYYISGATTNWVGELYVDGRTVSRGLNNNNEMVGYSSPRSDVWVFAAFIWSPDKGILALGGLPDYPNSAATGINDSSQVIGYCTPSGAGSGGT